MQINQNLKNIVKVIVSNFTLLFAGVATSFLLPKAIALETYGLYKIFNLYTVYIVLLQFGMAEGLYLIYAGKEKSEIDKGIFSAHFKAIIIFEASICIILFLVTKFFFQGEYKFIFMMLSINIFAVNITSIFQFISQAIQKFSELSIRNILKAIGIISAVIIVWVACKNGLSDYMGYKLFIVIIVAINLLLMIWYIISYRFLLVSPVSINLKRTLALAKLGFPLCISNIISTLILTIDRQVVSLFFNTEDYAIYAFAYSLLTLASTVITSIAVVIFPIFKKSKKSQLIEKYNENISIIIILVAGLVMFYFPLCRFIEVFLPEYNLSLEIFRIIIPGLIISSPVTIIMQNYFKVFNLNFDFLIRSLAILLSSVLLNVIAYGIFGTMQAISYASVITMLLWYFSEENRLYKEFSFCTTRSIIYMFTMCVIFYLVTFNTIWWKGLVQYSLLFAFVTYIFERKNILDLLKNIERMR